jgi:hypothetical protein
MAIGTIAALSAPLASAQTFTIPGRSGISCAGVQFTYSGMKTIDREDVWIDDGSVIPDVETFNFAAADHFVPLDLAGPHTVGAYATWIMPEGNERHLWHQESLSCGHPPAAPSCAAASVSARWHYQVAGGRTGNWSTSKAVNCPGHAVLSRQAMDGDLRLDPGTSLKVGYSFKPTAGGTVSVWDPTVVFTVHCMTDIPSQPTWVVSLADQTYSNVSAGSWLPSGDRSSAASYQRTAQVPDVCDGGKVRLEKGGVFATHFS